MDKKRHDAGAAEFRAWRETSGLSAVQVGQLVHATIDWGVGTAAAKTGRGRRTDQCRTVQKWEDGTRRIPADTRELLRAKVWLLRTHRATFQELVDTPLEKLLARLLNPYT